MPATAPLVSVMMPVLNPHPVYFREAIESILAQSLQDLELVIVEDPSQASGQAVIDQLGDSRIRYFRNTARTSLVEQRNKALTEARADIVACLDADDIA